MGTLTVEDLKKMINKAKEPQKEFYLTCRGKIYRGRSQAEVFEKALNDVDGEKLQPAYEK